MIGSPCQSRHMCCLCCAKAASSKGKRQSASATESGTLLVADARQNWAWQRSSLPARPLLCTVLYCTVLYVLLCHCSGRIMTDDMTHQPVARICLVLLSSESSYRCHHSTTAALLHLIGVRHMPTQSTTGLHQSSYGPYKFRVYTVHMYFDHRYLPILLLFSRGHICSSVANTTPRRQH